MYPCWCMEASKVGSALACLLAGAEKVSSM